MEVTLGLTEFSLPKTRLAATATVPHYFQAM